MAELDERVARVREMCTQQLGDSALLAHHILLTLDGAEPEKRGEKSDLDDECFDGPHEPFESTFLEKLAGRTVHALEIVAPAPR